MGDAIVKLERVSFFDRNQAKLNCFFFMRCPDSLRSRVLKCDCLMKVGKLF